MISVSEQLPREPRTLEELSAGTIDAAKTASLGWTETQFCCQIHATKFQEV